tara:strand:+ start:2213 stop:2626 length:414 start_codon:yes stop_codon:yes gene_type:complete
MIYYLLSFFVAIAGFALAFYIRYKKTSEKQFTCPLKADCHTVVRSSYSQLFGIPVELWGMLYYFSIAFTYLIVLVSSEDLTMLVIMASLLTLFAFAFSVYLTYVQAFKLHQWCTWCLISAGFCVALLSFSIIGLLGV